MIHHCVINDLGLQSEEAEAVDANMMYISTDYFLDGKGTCP